ncbi:tyrosine-type recombinase/integrase [Paraburkholderia heleia]|uniref:tyrosine-type recombinase/integrase n=1 Tax=Paraburkholderia heleia TaxID=634127 RepID=UPI003898F32B
MGIDPGEAKKSEKHKALIAAKNSFEVVARAWQAEAKKDRTWSQDYSDKVVRALELHVFPWVGQLPMPSIPQAEIVKCLYRIKDRGHLALQLAPIAFQRPGQLRFAHWEDMDLDAAIWTWPPEKMKIREWRKQDSRTPPHLVPLPRQAVELLRDIHPVTGPTGPIFRSMARRSEGSRYMSENTINSALRTLGYDTQEDITGHGFRATARTLIREYLGWDPDVIERHLAHGSDEELGDSYDRATLLERRRHRVQAWADLLDVLAEGKVPAPVRKFGKMQADFVEA